MSKVFKPRRGSANQVAAFVGEANEVILNTTTNTLHVMDGLTAGGFPLARADEVAQKNAAQDTAIASKLDKTGGTMTGALTCEKAINAKALNIDATTTPTANTYGDPIGWLDKNGARLMGFRPAKGPSGGLVLQMLFGTPEDQVEYPLKITRTASGEYEFQLNEADILTSAGGEVDGALKSTSTIDLIQSAIDVTTPGSSDRYGNSFGWHDKNNKRIASFRPVQYANGTLQLQLMFGTTAGGTEYPLALSRATDGTYTFNLSGSAVLTANKGNLMNASNVVTKTSTSKSTTAPSGGTWAWFGVGTNKDYDYIGFGNGTVAGGGTVTAGDSNTTMGRFIFFKIA